MRMDLMGIANRFRIKRKNVLNETKSIQEILNDMHDEINTDIIELMETIQPIENCTPLVNDVEDLQGSINEKTLQAHENSKRLMNIISQMQKGKIQAERLDQIEPTFDKNHPVFLENQGFASGGNEKENKDLNMKTMLF